MNDAGRQRLIMIGLIESIGLGAGRKDLMSRGEIVLERVRWRELEEYIRKDYRREGGEGGVEN